MRGNPLGLAVLGLAFTSLAALAQVPSVPTTPATPAAPMAPAAPAISPTLAAATVNGESIYEVAVQRALERIPPEKRAANRMQVIDYLADNLVIDQSLRAAPAYKVPDTEVDKRVEDMKAELKKIGRDFSKMLGELRVTESELRSHIGADLRWFKYANAQATDRALMELFNREKDMFDGTSVRARHILVSPTGNDEASLKAAAEKLMAIKKTVDMEVEAELAKMPTTADKLTREKARGTLVSDAFARHAKEKSECPTKAAGGDVNWFQKAGLMVAPFANAAFALQVGQVSDPVRTPFGLHLILVTERRPGKEVKFEDNKDLVREIYFDRLRDHVAAHLRSKAKIAVHAAPR